MSEKVLKFALWTLSGLVIAPIITFSWAVYRLDKMGAQYDAEISALQGDVANLRMKIAAISAEVKLLKSKPILMKSTWYGNYKKRRRMANGEWFDKRKLTCAHRTLPLYTFVHVQLGDKQVVLKVTDRGPEKWTGKDIDITERAAEILGMKKLGVATLTVRRII